MRKILFILIIAPMLAHSQALTQSMVTQLQPQIHRDSKGFKGCGVHVFAVTNVSQDATRGRYYDFSIVAYSDFLAIVKAGSGFANTQTKEGETTMPPPNGFWIVRESEGVRLQGERFINAETKGYSLGYLNPASALQYIDAIASGARIQFSIIYPNQPLENVIAISAKFNERDAEAFAACMTGLFERMKRESAKLPST
jgi:hypothetical protein